MLRRLLTRGERRVRLATGLIITALLTLSLPVPQQVAH